MKWMDSALALTTFMPIPKSKQIRSTFLQPYPPCLGPVGAIFFAWLMKTGEHRFRNKLSICEIEWERTKRICGITATNYKNLEFERCMKCIGEDIVYKTIDHGENVVKLTKKGRDWAERWTVKWGTYRGHHDDHITFEDDDHIVLID